jgi:hypothetical protein
VSAPGLADAVAAIEKRVAAEVLREIDAADEDDIVSMIDLVERVRALQPSKPATPASPEATEEPEVVLDEEGRFDLAPSIGNDGDRVRVDSCGAEGRVVVDIRDRRTHYEMGARVVLSVDELLRVVAAARKILAGGAS